MSGIQLIRDSEGKLTEIRVDAVAHPELAEDIFHLISAVQRAKDTKRAQTFKQSSSAMGKPAAPMTAEAFNDLIQQAKASGELSEAEFFQQNPSWQKKEKSFSRA